MEYINTIDFLNQKTKEYRKANKLAFNEVIVLDLVNEDPEPRIKREEALKALAKPVDSNERKELERKLFENLDEVIRYNDGIKLMEQSGDRPEAGKDIKATILREKFDDYFVAQYDQDLKTGEASAKLMIDDNEYYLSRSKTWQRKLNLDEVAPIFVSLDREDQSHPSVKRLKLAIQNLQMLDKLKDLEKFEGQELRDQIPVVSRLFQEMLGEVVIQTNNNARLDRVTIPAKGFYAEFKFNENSEIESLSFNLEDPSKIKYASAIFMARTS